MPSTSIQSTSAIPRTRLANLSSTHQASAMASNLSSVQALGEGAKISMNTESQTPDNPLIMSKNELHSLNSDKQANKLVQLFKNSSFLGAKDITAEMVKSVLNSDGMGDLNQQSLNYRPECSLIILSLLKPNEMNDELLKSAAKMINEMQNIPSLAGKKIIKGALAEFDKKIQSAMSKIEGDNFSTMVDRFKEVYVIPEFENKLAPHLSENNIKNLSIKDCLVSVEYQKKVARVETAKQAYQNTGANSSVDKSFYLHEAFETSEEFLEIPKTLKVTVDWKDKIHPVKSENVPSDKTHPSDEVDGFPHQSKASSAGNISNSYNTTTTNNYFNTPFSENIKQVSSQERAVNHEQDSYSSNKTENVSANPFDNDEFSSQNTIKLPRVALKVTVEEPLPDYDFFHHSAQNSQEIDTVKSRHFIEPSHVDAPWEPSSTQEEKIVQSTKDQFKLATELAQKNSQPMDIKPKMGSHYGSYLIDNKVPNGVKLTHNREPVQNKSPKQAESESYLAIKNASHYRTSYMNNDDKVVLSAEGLMTRNLNEKLAYINKLQGE